jgi:CspA family cold shock protein
VTLQRRLFAVGLPLVRLKNHVCSIFIFCIEEICQVAMGTVKWFNTTKGYGFIKPDAGGPDVFVHISAVERAGYAGLAEGAKVSYELATGRTGKASAEQLRIG